MKLLQLAGFLVIIFITGCRGCNDQAEKIQTKDSITINSPGVSVDTSTAKQEVDTSNNKTEEPGNAKKEKTNQTGPNRDDDSRPVKKEPGVLANIDNYLVSVPKFVAGPNGGISQASITVRNTMSNTSFQRVMLEVTQLASNGSVIDIAYHNLVNLGPGESKEVSLPDNPKVAKIISHVVKVTSKELTNGESVITGAGYKG
jgi:hypothetical protein